MPTYIDNDFEWDEEKNSQNQDNHGYSFEQARLIWDDEIVIFEDKRPYPERRWIALGFLDSYTILFVVYTWRGKRKRIISAREAEPHEIQRLIRSDATRRRRR